MGQFEMSSCDLSRLSRQTLYESPKASAPILGCRDIEVDRTARIGLPSCRDHNGILLEPCHSASNALQLRLILAN